MIEKVTYFDVEYANSQNMSICQIGISCENFITGDPYHPERDIYINPEDNFDIICVKTHNITYEQVKDKQTFPIVWKDIEKYFTNSIVIGHNVATSDLNALVKTLKRYNIDIPEMYYICTLDLARKYVPSYEVENYSLTTLCTYFNVDIGCEHNAFDDCCACADLFKAIVDKYSIDINTIEVKKFNYSQTNEFARFISNPEARKAVSEFYGIIRGFSMDNQVTSDEFEYIKNWQAKFSEYSKQPEISAVVSVLNKIIYDGKITLDEITELQHLIKSYLDIVSTSPITLATQILDGILRGITLDGKISETECKNLRQWLYDNIYLSNHFPFNKTIKAVEKILEDSVVTKEESVYLNEIINKMLDPIDHLKEQVNSVEGKHVCLSGDFEYGKKSDVADYIISKGGIIDPNLKKTTNILMIGKYESKLYSNGTYGSKVKKAIEFNERGSNIKIVKESDFFSSIK
ncbi:MAG TPA: hypothetical protein IAD47_02270 [Candidatus Limihabitans stercoravium]|nr:hypothetical protein [Candidatus Limihabitans stercoravium]